MKHLLAFLFLLPSTALLRQSLDKGIYRGEALPFTICYLTYSDSVVQVEYFYKKGGQIFGHIPARKLQHGMESYSTKPIFKSVDDSIQVYAKKGYYLVKRKGGKGTSKIKVYKTTDGNNQIDSLRLRHQHFRSYHPL